MTEYAVIPHTGETVDLNGPIDAFADAMEQLGQIETEIRTVKREISDEVARRLDHEGRRSIEIGDVKLTINAPTERKWDMPELLLLMAELVNEGTISQAKAERCIKMEPKPVWAELKTLLSDPRCQARLEHCYADEPANRYARVSR
jgi:hypothetical protein